MTYSQDFQDQLDELITGPWQNIQTLANELQYNKPKGESWDSHAEQILLIQFEKDGIDPAGPENPESDPETIEPESQAPDTVDEGTTYESESGKAEPESDQDEPEAAIANETREENPMADETKETKIPDALRPNASVVVKEDIGKRKHFFSQIDVEICEKCNQQPHYLNGKQRFCPVLDKKCEFYLGD
jgi:hypothetical protein